jgi:DNA-binding PadR family transcriptional regulator
MPNPFDAFESLRSEFAERAGSRASRGDVRTAVLLLLQEKPQHGYQIIREIEQRSDGAWRPSPGSVYPTLQLLADEGLVVVADSAGRKTYSLTDEGEEAARTLAEDPAPWETPSVQDAARAAALPKAGMKLGQAVTQVATSGTREQSDAAIEVLEEARRKIYAILADA